MCYGMICREIGSEGESRKADSLPKKKAELVGKKG